MSERELPTLPEGGQWATGPLLVPGNLGKYVWTVWNGNTNWATLGKIVKLGRTNIHVETSNASYSLRVSPSGHEARGNKNGFTASAHTEQWRLERSDRRRFCGVIERAMKGYAIRDIPTDVLRQVATMLAEHNADLKEMMEA